MASALAPPAQAAASKQQELMANLLSQPHIAMLAERSPKSDLMAAAASGDVAVLSCLLEAGAQVSAIDDTGMCALGVSAAHGHTEAAKALIARGANVNATDKQGRTPLMHAVLGGHLDTAVQIALGGTDMTIRDQHGCTALDHAIDKMSRQLSLALMLIATGKFSRPLEPMLTMRRLQQLRGWVADKQGKNAGAMGALLHQHVSWLAPQAAEPSGAAAAIPASAAERAEAIRGLLATVGWAAQHGQAQLLERTTQHLGGLVGGTELCAVQTEAGQTAVHVLALAGRGDTIRALVQALPRAEAAALLNRRDSTARLAHQQPLELVATPLQPAARDVLREVEALWREVVPPEEQQQAAPMPVSVGGGGAAGQQAAGRGGAVRRRSGSGTAAGAGASAGVRATEVAPAKTKSPEMDDARSVAAGDLLQLAAAASCSQPTGSRARTSRPRDAKPYQRPGKGRGGGQGRDTSWLPGGLWWQEPNATIPAGRQPGEFAGWQPLADQDRQQQEQQQKQLISEKEMLVKGLESRDDAIDYMYRLKATCNDVELAAASATSVAAAASTEAQPIRQSVDDSVITPSNIGWKQLTGNLPGGHRYGGFRRHFVDAPPQALPSESPKLVQSPHAKSASAAPGGSSPAAAAALPDSVFGSLAQRLQEKKAEVLAARRALEALLEEERELEAQLAAATSSAPQPQAMADE